MKIITLTGKIKLLSGLHIGGGDDTMKIGGIDNGIIKTTNGNKPYIPGSSLKGKMRSLLEWNFRLVNYGDGNPFHSGLLNKIPEPDKDDALNLLKLFGNGKSDDSFEEITRVSFGDCQVIENGMKLTEGKWENSINRIKGTASNPRQTERVPAGVEFEFDIRVKVLDNDSEEEFKKIIEKGLELIELDYLGGNGSRGYGRVKFIDKQWS